MKNVKRRVASLALVGTVTLALLGLGGAPAAADALHPGLTVTATTSITCAWGITKTGPASLTLAVNEGFDVPFTVNVTKTCTNHVSGTVTGDGTGGGLTVTLSDGTNAAVSGCTSDGHTFSCNFDGHPPSTADGTVTATTTTDTGSAAYSFHGVVADEPSVDILDTNLSAPLAIHLDQSATFNYTVHVAFSTCGPETLTNTASVKDTTILATSTVTVAIDVPCGGGCTLTLGYWKTHSKYGPAPSDPTWNGILPSGPDTAFFLSGQTWYQVFNTAPSGGNAYYVLAHQYMAARLNMLAGASSTPAVNAALAWATTFFSTYTPSQIGALKGSDPLRATAIANASTLESYNTGATGPGHCSE